MAQTSKIIVRVVGGLGNQLFGYAAARRLSLVSGAELVIDDETGFARDHVYKRKYGLDVFDIKARKATNFEKLKPFERVRRKLLRTYSDRMPFESRIDIRQEGSDFDPRLLQLRPKGTVYLEGVWASEGYFLDVAQTIRKDLRLTASLSDADRATEAAIRGHNSVALHVRWFDAPGSAAGQNAPLDYYRRAIDLIEFEGRKTSLFRFSDNPEAVRARRLSLPAGAATFVNHNDPETQAHADIWLMSRCDHFIIANSTFSWWGAWLGMNANKIVIAPSTTTVTAPAWTFCGLISGCVVMHLAVHTDPMMAATHAS